jgi:hypothetical protein
VGEILSSNSISGTIPNLLLLYFFDPHADMRALSVSVSGGQRLVSIRVRATSAVLAPPVSDPNWDPSRYRKFSPVSVFLKKAENMLFLLNLYLSMVTRNTKYFI